jgi:hypothetical protein
MERVGLDHPPNSDATVVYGYCKEKIRSHPVRQLQLSMERDPAGLSTAENGHQKGPRLDSTTL